MNGLLYCFKEGFSKVFSKKGAVMTVASICIAAAVLTLIGLFSALGINAAALTQRLGSNAEINIYIKSDLGDRDITDIETDLKHIDGVANVRFYSREDRMEKVSREVYGDDGYIFEQGENPLRDSYIITVSDLSKISAIVEKAKATDGVDEVIANSATINGIQTFISALKRIGMWLMIILILLAVFITANSIRLKLSSNADEIRIMQIVGATNSFIGIPYVIQGMIIGFIGAVLGAVITLTGYVFLTSRFEAIIPQGLMQFVSPGEIAVFIIPLFILSGIVVGALASGFALRRYFKG